MAWKLHWKLNATPLVLSDWWGDLSISLPHSGSAAHLFYDRAPEQPELATELDARLAPGGVFVDVGAHIGMYSLIAAQKVGSEGRVFAIEPQSACWTPLQANLSLNALDNVLLVAAAVGDVDGETRFLANDRSMGGMISESGDTTVPIMRLDTFAQDHGLGEIDVLKLDAAGNEYAALRGAGELLANQRIKALLCKLYHPTVVAERFGYDASLTVRQLREAGYLIHVLATGTQPKDAISGEDDVASIFDWSTYGRTLLAVPSG